MGKTIIGNKGNFSETIAGLAVGNLAKATATATAKRTALRKNNGRLNAGFGRRFDYANVGDPAN